MKKYREATGSPPATINRPASRTERIQTSRHKSAETTPQPPPSVTPGKDNAAYVQRADSNGYLEILPDTTPQDLPPPDYDFPEPPPPLTGDPVAVSPDAGHGVVIAPIGRLCYKRLLRYMSILSNSFLWRVEFPFSPSTCICT